MYRSFSLFKIILRRIFVVLAGLLSFPIVIFLPISTRSRIYSYLDRYWLKTSNKPVWLKQTEHGAKELY
ncbi:DUF2517 family protein [Photobacterium indicum]|uniref:DUF2517 domain-containing protein n=1 Tax=Photobacterium indicum TaxID=81447 RepID=A0A2T3LB80_9GAMM|nr:DUF2517 family protein [Photobacterium indicum]PSV48596.1 DUF2517 domain-containing protein [Photobacterium indicum]